MQVTMFHKNGATVVISSASVANCNHFSFFSVDLHRLVKFIIDALRSTMQLTCRKHSFLSITFLESNDIIADFGSKYYDRA